MLAVLGDTAQQVQSAGVTHAHDLTGRIFQRLIADRKYLATFYTRPESAALLARLAVAKLETTGSRMDWSDAGAIGRLRIGDFACGTGALLSAVYEQVAARHQRAGGDLAALHPVMMEEVLYGCDVMPSAVHITSATLSGVQPDVTFNKSRIYTMPYGRPGDGSVSIGSLELLQPSQVLTLFNTNDPALRTGSAGEETAAQINVDIPDGTFDIVIMNPPFTRNTTHEAAYADTFGAAFAAFEATDKDQKDMSKRMDALKKGTCYHGNAGVASAFAALADRKLKQGGVLALVLPLSAASGLSWQSFRQMLAQSYSSLDIVSIAANGTNMSFSSDTGMAECLVIARKDKTAEQSEQRAQLTSLTRRPSGFVGASEVAKNITIADTVRQIEDGPYGGTLLTIGEEKSGEVMTAPFSENGDPCGAVRLSDVSLAQTAYALAQSRLWLPGQNAEHGVNITSLDNIGRVGLYHLDIRGAPPRGPFDKVAPSPTATYPALWNHNAKNETRIVCEPDSELKVRIGMEEKANSVWETASRGHLNLEFTFGSQPLAVAFTNQVSIGGTAWGNIILNHRQWDYAFTAWGNCSLGLLSYWWHSSRQQSSKARMTIRTAESLPVLDFRALSDEQLAIAEDIFNDFRDRELKPAYLADADANRALLDRRVLCELLGLEEGVYQGVRRLAQKWCAEPSVHGGKARPKGAGLVV